jgi:hypothetical protein
MFWQLTFYIYLCMQKSPYLQSEKSIENFSPDGNTIGKEHIPVILQGINPSRRRSRTGGIERVARLYNDTKLESTKQSDEPESSSVGRGTGDEEFVYDIGMDRGITKEERERAAALRVTLQMARTESMQPSCHAEV